MIELFQVRRPELEAGGEPAGGRLALEEDDILSSLRQPQGCR
jgi:hypothetical protein